MATKSTHETDENASERKIRCEGQRPECGQCKAAGRLCGGYTIWDVDISPQEDQAPRQDAEAMSAMISPTAVNRCQLLSQLVVRHFPGVGPLAAPGCVHSEQVSFLHTLATSAISSTPLRVAVETLCIDHLSNLTDSAFLKHPLQQSYGWALGLLRSAVTRSKSICPHSKEHRDTLAASVVLSMLPAPAACPNNGHLIGHDPRLHLQGALAYLREHGPSILMRERFFDGALFYNIHLHSVFLALAKRKSAKLTRPEWRSVQQIKANPKPEFPVAIRHLPAAWRKSAGLVDEQASGFMTCSLPAREFMIDYIEVLPGLLERADRFIATDVNDSNRQFLLSEFDCLIQMFEDLPQMSLKLPSDQPLYFTPLMVDVHDQPHLFQDDIEEHVYMRQATHFDDFYDFECPAASFSSGLIHQLYLLADCALLQILENTLTKKGFNPDVLGDLSFANVEHNAFWHASEICRCAYAFAQRGLTAARYLKSLLRCAANFFRSHGSTDELDWCLGCIAATESRIDRLQPFATPSICRLPDMVDALPDGCWYTPMAVSLDRKEFVQQCQEKCSPL